MEDVDFGADQGGKRKVRLTSDFCTILRAKNSQEDKIVMSYVVQSAGYSTQNRIGFQIKNVETGEVKNNVEPDLTSFQRII